MSSKGSLQVEVTVPSYFLCPISLELMRDPVTISSGQTFDRCSIQTWLDQGHNSCPVTRFPIDCLSEEPIPNHALRRLIQSWCLQHQSFGVERVLTPHQPPSLHDIPLLLDSLSSPCSSAFDSLAALQQLSRLALDRPLSRRTILLSGALPHLTKLLSRSFPGLAPFSSSLASAPTPRSLRTADEALMLLDLLVDPSTQSLSDHQKQLCDEELVVSLANSLLRTSKSDSRLKAASILLKLQPSDPLKRKMGEMQGFMGSLVAMIRKEDAPSSKAALGLLMEVCSASNRNRVLATEAGAMVTLAELLVSGQGSDRAMIETALKGLELLCQCAEGRAAAANDTSILVAVVKHMSTVSERAAHYAVHIVLLVTKWAPEASKVKSLMVKEGALLKAIAVAQSATAPDTRVAARKLAASLSDVVPPSHLSHTICIRLR